MADGGPDLDAQVAAAKAVCARCVVRLDCLDEALIRIPYGIAGGLTPDERRTRRPSAQVAADIVEYGLLPGALRQERWAAGQVLLTAGHPIEDVARRCGVSPRTAARWASRARMATAEGSAGGNRAPLLISHTQSTQTGTQTQEEDRS